MRWLLAFGLVCWASVAASAQSNPNKVLLTSQVVCGASATLIDGIRNRHAITVKVPLLGATVYIGPAGVNASTGFGIDAGAAMTLEPYSGALYCVSSSQTVQISQTLP